MPTAGKLCNRRLATARSTETLHEVAARMRAEHVGSVVVVDEQNGQLFPVGLLTDRDIVVAVLARGARRVERITVGEVVSLDPVTASEGEDIADLLNRMQSAGVRRIPIVNEVGALVGIVAFDDLLVHVAEQVNGLAQVLSRESSSESHARPLAVAGERRRPAKAARRPAPATALKPRPRPAEKARAKRTKRISPASARSRRQRLGR